MPTGVEAVVPSTSVEVNVGLPDGALKLYVIPAGGAVVSERVTGTVVPPVRVAVIV